jgi:hypothetical protein
MKMVEANHSLQQAKLRASMGRAAITLAHREAEKAVKRSLAAQGIKPQYVAKREISLAAREYLAQHPELIAEARPIVQRWVAEGFFGKRAARYAQNLEVTCNAGRPVTQGLSLNETHAQNGAVR